MTLTFKPDPHQVAWTNYQVLAASPSGFDAQTKWKMSYGYQSSARAVAGRFSFASVDVTIQLVWAECWVVDGRQTLPLLLHEQLHYVIPSLVAREFDAEASALTSSTPKGLEEALKRLSAEKIARANAIDHDYERHTDHSRNVAQQHIWAQRVEAWERNNFRIGWTAGSP
jgi:hypothetical protein